MPVSKVVPYEETKRPLVSADECDLPAEELIDSYLGGTPFVDLFKFAVPFEIPQKTRFEHHWIIGGTGHGKTNAIANLLVDDLQRVADGQASIVVINFQNALIPMLAHLPFFAKGGLLDGKLVLIDALDVEYPVALNLFDVGLSRLNSYSLLDRERLLNTSADVMNFILQSLLGADMTSRQSTLFGFSFAGYAAHSQCDHPHVPRTDGAGWPQEIRPSSREPPRARTGFLRDPVRLPELLEDQAGSRRTSVCHL